MFALPTEGQVHAQQAAPAGASGTDTCSNLDVIFLVDQSLYMGGLNLPGVPTGDDPTLQRKYAVEGMIDMLVDLAIGQCPNSYHRIGIISFANSAEVDLPLSNIAPANSDDANQLRDALKSHVKADASGHTNTFDAFTLAKKMFDDAGPTPAGTELRKRVIIQIANGFPCVDYPACENDYQGTSKRLTDQVDSQFPFSADLLARENCMTDLRATAATNNTEIPADKANACLANFPVTDTSYANSTYIWTILLKSDVTYPETVLENQDAMSKAHAGSVIQLSHNRGDIPSAMRVILSDLAGVQPHLLTCGENFAVNPYLRRMVINAYGIDANSTITMTYQDAQGTVHTINQGKIDGVADKKIISDYYTYGTNERYDIENPYPGLWQLSNAQNCNGLDVYYDPVNIDPQSYTPNLPDQIPQYDRAPYYDSDPKQQYFLEYKLKDTTGTLVPQADADIFHVAIDLNVTEPGGKTVAYPMDWVPSDGLFRAKNPLQTPVPGVYTINIKGTSHLHDGNLMVDSTNLSDVFNSTYTLFENATVQFNVFPVTPFQITILDPKANQTIRPVHASILQGWKLKVNPVPVRVRITDRQGKILSNIKDIFNDPSQALSATISGGSTSSSPVMLQPDPNIPGEFVGEIANSSIVGAQTLTVESQDKAINKQYRPDERQVELPFSRTEYFWTLAAFYYGLFALFVALIIILIVYNILIRTNKVNGTLEFKDGSTDIAEFGLANGINFRIIKGKELTNYPQLFLKSIKVENAGKKSKKTVDDAMADSSYGDIGSQGVRISLVTTGGRHFTMDLMPNLPTGYGDETMAQMIYVPLDNN